MNVILTLLFIGFLGWGVWFMLQPKTRRGTLRVNGRKYNYTIGDGQLSEVIITEGQLSFFNGIAIELPKAMPHIYLDSHHDDKLAGPRFYIPAKHKVSLEGDFDAHFQLYASDGYKQLALSIISPDVMQTLVTSAGNYDVEIKGLYLRLISQQPLFRNKTLQDDIVHSAEKVLAEVAHRLNSWSIADAANAHQTALPVEYTQTFKVGRRAIRSSWFRAAYGSILLGAIWTMSAFGGQEAAAKGNTDTLVYDFGSWQYFLGLCVCLVLPFVLSKIFSHGNQVTKRSTRQTIAIAVEIAKQSKK